MKKLLSLILTLATVTPYSALASNGTDLRKIFDQYNYAMTITWDGKDSAFAEKQEALLKTSLAPLVDAGLTDQDIKEAFPNINVAEIEVQLTQLNLHDTSAISSFIQMSRQNYKSGASYQGSAGTTIGYAILGAVAVALVIVLIRDRQAKDAAFSACMTHSTNVDYCKIQAGYMD